MSDKIEVLRGLVREVAKSTGWELRVEGRGSLQPVLWAKSPISKSSKASIEFPVILEYEVYIPSEIRSLILAALYRSFSELREHLE